VVPCRWREVASRIRPHTSDDSSRDAHCPIRHLRQRRGVSKQEIPAVIAGLLADHGSTSVVIPDGLPAAWQSAIAVTRIPDAPDLTPRRLDAVDSVISACALAIAETGTIVLDGGPGQGRRMLTLVPDHHICVIHVPEQVVSSVPRALPRLDPTRPLTWISGPSATSDIELDRVEGVHGPRTLDVILAG